jgi:hypothetical protein
MMNFWDLFWDLLSKYIKVIYRIMFVLGIGLLVLAWVLKILSLDLALTLLPIIANITAAYLWIRLDIWHTDKTIRELTSQRVAQNELISRRADTRVAFSLLVVIAIAQSILLSRLIPKLNFIVLFGELFMSVPLCNWIARGMEKRQSAKFK